MLVKNIVRIGIASLAGDGMRCGAPRKDDPSKKCRKLIAQLSLNGRLEGRFKCDRCGQVIECQVEFE
jgi:hypothetical protein